VNTYVAPLGNKDDRCAEAIWGIPTVAWHPIDYAARGVPPGRARMLDPQTAAALAAREATMAKLRDRLCRIARELTEAELCSLVGAMLSAQGLDRVRRPGSPS
jgi:hypothetical protein